MINVKEYINQMILKFNEKTQIFEMIQYNHGEKVAHTFLSKELIETFFDVHYEDLNKPKEKRKKRVDMTI